MSKSDGKPIHQLLTPDHSADCERNPSQSCKADTLGTDDKQKSGRCSPAVTDPKSSREDLRVDKQVSAWSVKDVEQWIRSKHLVKFITAVNKYKVTGKDLINLNLNFVYDNDVSPLEREALLSEAYSLVSPSKTQSRVERETRYSSKQEQEKYAAAMRVARSRDRSSSPSLVVFSRSPSPGGASVLSLPPVKTRSRSESGMDGMLSDLTPTASPARKYLKRKSTPNVLLAAKGLSRRPSLHQVFSSTGPQSVFCTVVTRGADGFNFVCDTSGNGPTIVTKVLGASPLRVGDFILEVNGISLIRGDNSSSTELLLERLQNKSESLQIVVARHERSRSESADIKDLNFKLSSSEKRWENLHDLLVGLKSENFDPNQMIRDTPPFQIQDVKDSIALQEEVDQLQEALSGHLSRVSDLQRTLDEKTVALLDIERQRDVALNRLETITLAKSKQAPSESSDTSEDSAGAGVYAELLESLDQDSTSKDDVLGALRETIKEAVTQKSYLDKLMCVVVEEAPWLLDIIDADLADLGDQSQGEGEEFC